MMMIDLITNIVILGAQSILMLIGSKFLIKMTRQQNIVLLPKYFNIVPSLSQVLFLFFTPDLGWGDKEITDTLFCGILMKTYA